jgi:hypothetical protein
LRVKMFGLILMLPYALVVISLLASLRAAGAALDGRKQTKPTAQSGVCPTCGYALVGLQPRAGCVICPECGTQLKERDDAPGKPGAWMWAWPAVVSLLTAMQLTDGWWLQGFQAALPDLAVPGLASAASGAGLCVLVVVTGRVEHVRTGERAALLIALGVLQIINAASWVAWEMNIVSSWG